MNTDIRAPHVGLPAGAEPRAEVAVVVPVYKGEAFLVELVTRLHGALQSISQSYQIILVDDRSPDGAWSLIEQMAEADSRVTGVRLSRNFGQHPAISAGIAYARADWYVVMDCDLQDPPEAIKALYEHVTKIGADVVIAERETSGLAAGRNIGSAIFNSSLRWASGMNVSSKFGNFRIFSNKVASAFRAYPEQFRLFPAIMTQLGFDTRHLVLSRHQRPTGKSSYNIFTLAKLAIETIVAYSEKPLLLMVALGTFVCGASLLFGMGIVLSALINGATVPGYATLASLISFLGGLQIFLVSLVGLYVGRALAEVKHRPVFIVDEISRRNTGIHIDPEEG